VVVPVTNGRHREAVDQFRAFEANASLVVDAAAIETRASVVVRQQNHAGRLQAQVVTGRYATVFRPRIVAGRFIQPADDTPYSPSVAVISDQLWTEWFRRDPTILGKITVAVDGRPSTIVGVASSDVAALTDLGAVDIWIPFAPWDPELTSHWIGDVGLKFNSSAEMSSVEGEIRRAFFANDSRPVSIGRLGVVSDRSARAGRLLIALAGIGWFGGLCHVCYLVAIRNTARYKDVRILNVLGARRAHAMLLYSCEAIAILAAGSILGACIVSVLAALTGPRAPIGSLTGTSSLLDIASLAGARPYYVSAMLVIISLSLCALLSFAAFQALRAPCYGGPSSVAPRSRLLRVILTTHASAAVVNLMVIGLFFEGAADMVWRKARVLYEPGGVMAIDVSLVSAKLPVSIGMAAWQDTRDITRAGKRPVLASALPGSQSKPPRRTLVMAIGPAVGRQRRIDAVVIQCSPGLPAILGRRLVDGRDFVDSDQDTTLPVALLSSSAARTLWPGGRSAIGREVVLDGESRPRQVVGIVDDFVADNTQAGPESSLANAALVPIAQHYAPEAVVLNRAQDRGVLEDVARGLLGRSPFIVVSDPRPAERLLQLTLRQRLLATATAIAGICILLGTGYGVYAVTTYNMISRTAELAIRSALGATTFDLRRLVVQESVRTTLIGILVGVFVAAMGMRALEATVYRLAPDRLLTWVLVPTVTLAAALFGALMALRTRQSEAVVSLLKSP
jgi:ABC-type antimicrobial peptide transport system permease subunit